MYCINRVSSLDVLVYFRLNVKSYHFPMAMEEF